MPSKGSLSLSALLSILREVHGERGGRAGSGEASLGPPPGSLVPARKTIPVLWSATVLRGTAGAQQPYGVLLCYCATVEDVSRPRAKIMRLSRPQQYIIPNIWTD